MTNGPETRTPFGPYETEQDTYEEPMPRELRRLHDAGETKSGDPDYKVRGTVLKYLVSTCDTARVPLGAFDRRTLAWLAGGEEGTAQVIIGLIYRAYVSGVHAGRVARTPPSPPWQQLPDAQP